MGHLAACTALCNRAHATLPVRKLEWAARLAIYAVNLGVPMYFLGCWIAYPDSRGNIFRFPPEMTVSSVYFVACWAFLGITTLRWFFDRLTTGQIPQSESNRAETVDLRPLLGPQPVSSMKSRLLVWVPGNRPFDVAINEKQISMTGLQAAFDGLTITHLSDFHLSGDIARGFFERIVERANDFGSDITVITGDLVDSTRCFTWIPEIFGQLRAPHGVFYVFGNHEERLSRENYAELHRRLGQQGLVYLGGRWSQVPLPGGPILLAGNSRPWCLPAPDMRDAPPGSDAGGPPRILLSHSPDQLPWARQHHFDLMLAGHTHGGQVCFPLIGAVICPSRFGTKYASGVFYKAPTLMHVSRGISGLTPLRINCRPEITKLVLRAPRLDPKNASPRERTVLPRQAGDNARDIALLRAGRAHRNSGSRAGPPDGGLPTALDW